jgi:lysozyme
MTLVHPEEYLVFMNDDMKTSNDGLELIAKWEGCILKPYKDIAGLRTIGIGHLIKPGEVFPDGITITRERALEILSQDVALCETAIKKNIKVPLNQNQFDALVSFGFNCGVGVYSNSGVATAVNSGNFAGVPVALEAWSKAKINGVSQTVPGLLARRKHEAQVFMTPDPSCIISDYPVPWTKTSLTEAQTLLKKLGLYQLSIDGLWGPGTNRAVTEFASRNQVQIGDASKGVPPSLIETLKRQAS